MPIIEYCVATCNKCPARLPGRFGSVSEAERAAESAGWWWGGHVTYDALLCLECRPPGDEPVGDRLGPAVETAAARGEVRTLRYADLELDVSFREITRGGLTARLTPIEFRLLGLLMRSAGEVVKRGDIVREVWGFDFPAAGSLDVYVGYLRRKTEAGGGSRLVQTVRGVGYAMREVAR